MKNVLRLLMGLVCIVLSGCATVSFDGAVRRGALATESELKSIEIVRQGKPIGVRQHLALEAGDRIRTDSESTAIISYASGTVVYVRPNSVVRIGSIFVEIGEIFVRARGFFQVDTEFVTAGVEGTEYVVRVGPQQRVGVVVLSGRVACTSKAKRWPKFTLDPYEKAKFERDGPPERSRADEAEIDEIRRWVAEIERVASPTVQLGGCCAGGKAFTADRLRCALNRGVYHETVEEARRSCAAAAASGWCCAGGQVTQSTGENCARREGRFYDDLDQAKKNCQPAQTSGWCCTSVVLGRERQFNLSESNEQSCAAARGQYYHSYAEAKNRCQAPPEPIGHCCVDYKISELTRSQCNERNGSFSNDRAALEKQCRNPRLDPRIRDRIYVPAPEPVIR